MYVFVPNFPSLYVLYSVLFIAFGCTIIGLLSQYRILIRLVLTFSLMWLNAVQWGYGYFSHVDYIFILSHLLSIFLPRKYTPNMDVQAYSQGIAFYRFGILVTYFMAGTWKIIALAYKFILPNTDYTWLHSKGPLLNAIVSLRGLDHSFGSLLSIFEIQYIWGLLFIVMVICQVSVIIGAVIDKFHPFIIIILIGFHFFNAIAFHTFFVWQPLIILILFFPYHTLLENYNTILPKTVKSL
jgi:hypothetical protein